MIFEVYVNPDFSLLLRFYVSMSAIGRINFSFVSKNTQFYFTGRYLDNHGSEWNYLRRRQSGVHQDRQRGEDWEEENVTRSA